jgi:hypothetical protein
MTGDDTVRLSYAELAQARGVTLGAARRMVHRHKWPKQVGNDGLSRISVSTTFLTKSDHDTPDVTHDVDADIADHVVPDVTPDSAELQVVDLEEAITAFASVARDAINDVTTDVILPLREAITSLRVQLDAERDRADRAEGQAREADNRAREAEGRVQKLQEQLQAEMIEHRQVVTLLLRRRSWWPWRRGS